MFVHKPRLLSDNGSSCVSGELAEWLGDKKMGHVRGAPYHPQTQGKTERWHQTLKNCLLLDNYFFPADLEAQILLRKNDFLLCGKVKSVSQHNRHNGNRAGARDRAIPR
jgi:transposase InsO family protein